jgi:hypothetical protein
MDIDRQTDRQAYGRRNIATTVSQHRVLWLLECTMAINTGKLGFKSGNKAQSEQIACRTETSYSATEQEGSEEHIIPFSPQRKREYSAHEKGSRLVAQQFSVSARL